MVILGKILSKVKFFFPDTVFSIRCKITDNLISKHAISMVEKAIVMNKANKFLATMSEYERTEVMKAIGVLPAPKWENNHRFHMGE